MPTAFAAEVVRRPIILIAAWLIVLQAFLAGVAIAQAAAVMTAPAPFDAGAICHGTGGAGTADRSVPEADKAWALCCAFCATASPAAAPLTAPDLTPVSSWERADLPELTRFTVCIARGVVRAGLSQAPPRLA